MTIWWSSYDHHNIMIIWWQWHIGLKHHIVEISGYVTMRDNKQLSDSALMLSQVDDPLRRERQLKSPLQMYIGRTLIEHLPHLGPFFCSMWNKLFSWQIFPHLANFTLTTVSSDLINLSNSTKISTNSETAILSNISDVLVKPRHLHTPNSL